MVANERTPQKIEADNNTRLRRAKAWMERAAQAAENECERAPMTDWIDDSAVQFVFWWIALEAAYGGAKPNRKAFNKFMQNFSDSEAQNESLGKMLDAHRESAEKIMCLRQTHMGFWLKKGYRNANNWQTRFVGERRKYQNGNAVNKIRILITRLRTVRNQIFHGANSLHGSHGLTQTRCGAELLSVFAPYFIKEMETEMKVHPERDWGAVPFPRVAVRDQQEGLLPIWADEC